MIPNSSYCSQRIYFALFHCYKIHWFLFYEPIYALSYRMFHVQLRRMCILMLIDGGFCRSLSILFGLHCCQILYFLVDPFSTCIHYLKWGTESSIHSWWTISTLNYVSFSFLCFEMLLLNCICVDKCYIFLMDWPFYNL